MSKAQKLYRGDRTIDGIDVTVDGRPLDDARSVKELSRAGFEWSFEGPPSAQLALAILVDHFGDPVPALALCPAFMRKVVAHFENEWEMTTGDIEHALENIAADA
jgi:hypothetical protein